MRLICKNKGLLTATIILVVMWSFCSKLCGQTNGFSSTPKVSIVNQFNETGKIFFSGEKIDSLKCFESVNNRIKDIDWNECHVKVNIYDTIYPKKSCVLYIKSYSKEKSIPIYEAEIDFRHLIINMIINYNRRLYDMLIVDSSNPLNGTKLKVGNIRYQPTAIFSHPIQKAIKEESEMVLVLYEDTLSLTTPVLPKIKSIEFIKPKD